MRQFLIDLLKRLEAAVPPPRNCHHAITFAQHGSDAAGWNDKLALQLNVDGKFYCFFLEDDDLSGDSRRVIEEISKSLAIPEVMQEGIAAGQYVQG